MKYLFLLFKVTKLFFTPKTLVILKKLKLSLLLFLFFIHAIPAQNTITIDAKKIIGPALQRGSGFLFGYDNPTLLPDSLLLPIKCRFQRTGITQTIANYERNRKMGCSMEVILGFIDIDENPMWKKDELPGANGNWKPWEDYVAMVLKDFKSRGMIEEMSFSIWDNPDRDNGFWPSDEHYFEAWCKAQRQVKSIMPEAKMVGPSCTQGPATDWWQNHYGDDTWYVRQFTDYAIANGCTPDILSRHDHYMDGYHIEFDDKRLNEYFEAKGIPPIPFEQDDLGARYELKPIQFNPAHYVSLFASVERVKILRTAKCSWDKDANTNTLSGLLTQDNRQKRSLWWTYKAYADLTGEILSVNRGNDVDAVAALDKTDKKLRILIGYSAEKIETVVVKLKNLKTNSREITLLGWSIPNSNADAAPVPVQTINKTIRVKKGMLKFQIADLGKCGAYSIEISRL